LLYHADIRHKAYILAQILPTQFNCLDIRGIAYPLKLYLNLVFPCHVVILNQRYINSADSRTEKGDVSLKINTIFCQSI